MAGIASVKGRLEILLGTNRIKTNTKAVIKWTFPHIQLSFRLEAFKHTTAR